MSLTDENYYDMNMTNGNPRQPPIGYALIINQVHFEEPTKIKDKFSNSHIIAGKLSAAFRHIGLEPVTYTDLSAEDLCNLCLDYSKRKILEEHDVFVMLVISHSAAGHIYCTDAALPLNVILEFFNEENCPNLKGKPKIFFIQAYCNHIVDSIQLFDYHGCTKEEPTFNYIPLCQSSTRNHQPSPTDLPKEKNGKPLEKFKANGSLKDKSISKSQGIQLPAPESDFLIYYSTSAKFPEEKSTSNQQTTDQKISNPIADLSFCVKLDEMIRDYNVWKSDFLYLLTLLNGKLDEENKTKKTIVRILTYQFTKNLELPDRQDDLKLP